MPPSDPPASPPAASPPASAAATDPTEELDARDLIEATDEAIDPGDPEHSTKSTKPANSTNSAEPDSTEPRSAGPRSDEPRSAGPRSAGPRSAGPRSDEPIDAVDLVESTEPVGPVESIVAPGSRRSVDLVESAEPVGPVEGIVAPGSRRSVDLHARRVDLAVAVYEPDDEARSLASAGVLSLGYKLVPVDAADPLEQFLSAPDRPDVVLLALPEGAAIAEAAAALGPARPVLVGSVSGPALTARTRSKGSDLFTVKPHTPDSLAPILHAATLLATERQRLHALEGNEKRLRDRLQQYGKGDPVTGFQHFVFFQHHLVREIERARHFGYSLAVCLVGLDPWQSEAPPSAALADKVRASVARAIAAVIRPVDSPVDFADDRFLVFMPYTEIEAAETAGQRIVRAVRSCELVRDAGRTIRLSVSIGIAALAPGEAVSFSRLVRDAGAAMRAAQLKGGDRVVVR